MRTLLINNYDSFTFNLFQLISTLSGIEPLVVDNDKMTWNEVCRLDFANIVISPGPGRPVLGQGSSEFRAMRFLRPTAFIGRMSRTSGHLPIVWVAELATPPRQCMVGSVKSGTTDRSFSEAYHLPSKQSAITR